MKNSSNRALCEAIGIEHDWFKTAMFVSAIYAKGAEQECLAFDAIADLLLSLQDENNKLTVIVKRLKAEDKTNEMLSQITWSLRLRARRFATNSWRSKESKMTVSLASMVNDDFDPIAPPISDYSVDDIKNAVIAELQRMADNASEAKRNRLELAVKVAPVRMSNPPEVQPLKRLMEIFQVKKVTMHHVIQDIQEAFVKVAKRMDLKIGLAA